MPINRIVVTWDGTEGYRCGVWDKNGVAHEVTDVFQMIRGATGEGKVYNEITCKKGDLTQKIEFRPNSKRLVFDCQEDVVDQILALHEE